MRSRSLRILLSRLGRQLGLAERLCFVADVAFWRVVLILRGSGLDIKRVMSSISRGDWLELIGE